MSSTFHGLETSLRGLRTHQSALNTTGHNISNASTPGYSRQRVNFSQTEPYPAAARNRPQVPGQMGTGVEAGTVQRVRESFLDLQFRGENTKSGYWASRSDALQKMEEVMNEPSDHGLAKTMDRFWQSLQDLAVNPEDSGARSVVRQRGIALAETFNYLSSSLNSIRDDFKTQIDVTAKEINSIAEQINDINKQIGEIEPHGYLTNDLYDKRDALVDRLSELANVKVTAVGSGGQSLDIAEGKYTIELMDASGNSIGTLVDGANLTGNTLEILDSDSNGLMDSFALTPFGSNTQGPATPIENFTSKGKLLGLIESYGKEDTGGNVSGIYPEMLSKVDEMAYQFATEFNNVHESGYGLSSTSPNTNTGKKFFDELTSTQGAASQIKLHSDVTGANGLNNIAASTDGNAGDGSNALALGEVKDETFTFSSGDSTLQSFYEGIIGEMAVDAQQANRLMDNSNTLKQSVEERRQSVSGVSLDEEMTKMMQFQHAYNAAARNITSIDEMLDRIINGMGRVGR
ncbi:flagellar hook-associated protein FlgK [Pseudalkalibacillus berkeleyi]|uniref:Flagellar hook-associated protein 1 n=1 Tax=Pseudalkalibacillus berkeleyi TaxID=1069813 RepID=A0ABS9H4J8_9BACL|nr:flagellar hook-associated protein FlgK [Pseudalkalibacillus berkeleyi]MCF6138757.1 flagellar hook-associated protein FlgK [Pseudalkalibacillus berkeleyi]